MIVKQQLAEIVGPDSISNDAEALDAYCRDFSFANQIRPSCVVKPTKADEVRKIIQLANETETALVPVSSGAPHFKGDTVPGTGGSVIVDLSRMN